jgi:prophage regulatory protein
MNERANRAATLVDQNLVRPDALPRIVSPKEVQRALGMSKSTLWRWVQVGQFPKPAKIGPGRIGWLETDVATWIESRFASRNA